MTLLVAARAAGARLKPACEVLGLSVRTVERWMPLNHRDDRRCGPRRSPSNKLSAQERTKVLTLLHSEPFRDLPPAQVVVRLADDGQYLASESTMYRLLRDQAEAARRDGARPSVARSPRRHDPVLDIRSNPAPDRLEDGTERSQDPLQAGQHIVALV